MTFIQCDRNGCTTRFVMLYTMTSRPRVKGEVMLVDSKHDVWRFESRSSFTVYSGKQLLAFVQFSCREMVLKIEIIVLTLLTVDIRIKVGLVKDIKVSNGVREGYFLSPLPYI